MSTSFRLNIVLLPNDAQASWMRRCAGASRFAYNWGLDKIKHSLADGRRKKRSVGEWRTLFNQEKLKNSDLAWLAELPYKPVEHGFQCLDRAVQNFFDSRAGRRKGNAVGFPRFKSRHTTRPTFFLLQNDKSIVDDRHYRVGPHFRQNSRIDLSPPGIDR